MVLGHLGAIAGALYVGTIGVLLCYVAGIWGMVTAWKSPGGRGDLKAHSHQIRADETEIVTEGVSEYPDNDAGHE